MYVPDKRSSAGRSRGPLIEELETFMNRPASDKILKSRKSTDWARNDAKAGLRNQKRKDELLKGLVTSELEGDEDLRSRFRYDVELDTAGEYVLYWDTDFNQQVIKFHLEASLRKSDVLAFGFSDYGEAHDADLVVLWTDSRGRQRFQVSLKVPDKLKGSR